MLVGAAWDRTGQRLLAKQHAGGLVCSHEGGGRNKRSGRSRARLWFLIAVCAPGAFLNTRSWVHSQRVASSHGHRRPLHMRCAAQPPPQQQEQQQAGTRAGRPERLRGPWAEALYRGCQVHGKVMEWKESQGAFVDIGHRALVYIPKREMDGEHKVGDSVGLWILDVRASGSHLGTMKPERVVTEPLMEELRSAAQQGDFLPGVVDVVQEKFAGVIVTLPSSATAYGWLHLTELGRRSAVDVTKELSVGEHVSVRVLQNSEGYGRHKVQFSLCRSITAGSEQTGLVVEVEPAGVAVDIGVYGRVFLPRHELDHGKLEVSIGDSLSLWIVRVSRTGGNHVGTLKKEKAMTPSTRRSFEAAAKSGKFLEGVVDNVGRKMAGVLVTLPDGTRGYGTLHHSRAAVSNKTDMRERLSVGEAVRVRVLDVQDRSSGATDRLELSEHPLVVPGAHLRGRILRVAPEGVGVSLGARESAYIPMWDIPANVSIEVGIEVRFWVTQTRRDGSHKGTMKPEKLMTEKKMRKFEAAALTGGSFDGTVKSMGSTTAEVMVILEDGTSGLGLLHVSHLAPHPVEDISKDLFVGDTLRVKIIPQRLRTRQDRLEFSVVPIPFPGQRFNGFVTKVDNAGAVVDIGAREGVFLPRHDIADKNAEGTLLPGNTVTLWIAAIKDSVPRCPIGTIRREKAMSWETLAKFEVVAKEGQSVTGVVDRVEKAYANILVSLADGTTGYGILHCTKFGRGFVRDMANRLSVQQEVEVRVVPKKQRHIKSNLELVCP